MAECISALRDQIARLEMRLTTVRGETMRGRVGRKPKEAPSCAIAGST